jgi:hypothetical protein
VSALAAHGAHRGVVRCALDALAALRPLPGSDDEHEDDAEQNASQAAWRLFKSALRAVADALLAHRACPCVQAAGLTALQRLLAWESIGVQRATSELRVHEAVVAAMRAHEQDHVIQARALQVIVLLLCRGCHLVDTGVLEAIAAAMRSHSAVDAVQQSGCTALQLVFVPAPTRAPCVPDLLFGVLRAQRNAETLECACGALSNVLMAAKPDTVHAALEGGAAEVTAAAMRMWPQHDGLQNAAVGVLLSLLARCGDDTAALQARVTTAALASGDAAANLLERLPNAVAGHAAVASRDLAAVHRADAQLRLLLPALLAPPREPDEPPAADEAPAAAE